MIPKMQEDPFSLEMTDKLTEDALSRRIIFLDDDITPNMTKKVYYVMERMIADSLEDYSVHHQDSDIDLSQIDPIRLVINSAGGDAHTTLALCDLIESSPVLIHTHVVGLAASGAAYVAICGHYRTIHANSQMMLHGANWPIGRAFEEDVKRNLQHHELFTNSFKDMLTRNTRMTSEEIKAYLNKEPNFISAADSLRMGLIDSIIKPLKHTRLYEIEQAKLTKEEGKKEVKKGRKSAKTTKLQKST